MDFAYDAVTRERIATMEDFLGRPGPSRSNRSSQSSSTPPRTAGPGRPCR